MWVAAAFAAFTPVVLSVLGWRFRDPLASDLGIDRARVKRQAETFAKFCQQVGINVLANLIAAAIVYLVAVLTGLLPTSPRTTLLAASFIFMASAIILFPFARSMSGKRGFLLAGVVLILIGVAAVIAPLASSKLGWEGVILPIVGWVTIIMGIFFIYIRHQWGDN